MFVIINQLHFTKPVDEFIASIEAEGLPLLESLPGFVDFKFVKIAEDRAVVLLFWETGADAQNGAAQFGLTWFAKNFAPLLASEQVRVAGQVVVQH
ncbi:MAG: hypothetical protein H6636_10445 [Anaerolineales bacterium]|nr:hypothetical protein [Anaerolineales bacterium]